MTRPPKVVWAGLAVVLAAAAVLSFDALRALAVAVAIPGHLAWLLPIAVDAGAAVSCATWLGGRTTRDAARFAGRMTWALLVVTVAGNAGQLGMHAHNVDPPWWVAVAVGSIPPAVVGATVHLVVLLVRHPALEVLATTPPAAPPAPPAEVEAEPEGTPTVLSDPPDVGDDVVVDLQPLEDEPETVEQRAARLIADGAGRQRLIKELEISEWKARQLLAAGGAR
ncbi:DUF2637 domain-containing protein [Pseudonocardia broussonetiae]|uniref:DUF2637 domain-containing protein n=1 Tax=Pseudonocardia broussonetiae TaxID=2736640 RepID=A0A6M6JHI5_9PSEU|nr:DUF2637 domain-containing protein [Pseudonocardia broussonetiae]QJY46635.1 DUF2637 domain-containing protein [Pseudonocardia broussonetiae]